VIAYGINTAAAGGDIYAIVAAGGVFGFHTMAANELWFYQPFQCLVLYPGEGLQVYMINPPATGAQAHVEYVDVMIPQARSAALKRPSC